MSGILNRLDPGGVPHMPFPALARFAHEYPEHARALLDSKHLDPERFGRSLILRFDHLIRSGHRNTALLATVDACHRVLSSDVRHVFLQGVAADAQRASLERATVGRMRSLWGTTPILNIIPAAKADRLLGVEAETVVFTTYRITSDFDVILKQQQEWILDNATHLYCDYFWMVFLWALVGYDVFFYFNDRGIVLPTGGYGSERFGINLEEMKLLRQAGKRLYTLTYGADYRTRERTLKSSKFNFCMDCKEIGKYCICDDEAGRLTHEKISQYATATLAMNLANEYLPNPRSLNYAVIDVSKFEAHSSHRQPGQPLRIVHCPNHAFFKGTHHLEAVVARLQKEGKKIELSIASGISNKEVHALFRDADVVADQFIGGWFGYIAIEAMAMGKPVLVYLRDIKPDYDSAAVPVINSDPDNLYDALSAVIADPGRLKELGARARRYVELHHSIEAFAERLRALYLETGAFSGQIVGSLSGDAWALKWEHRARNMLWRATCWTMSRVARARRRAYANVKTALAKGEAGLSTRRAPIGRAYAALRAATVFTIARATRLTQSLKYRAARIAITLMEGLWHAALPLVIWLARALTAWRLQRGTPSSMWGITPILTLPLLARCDRQLGLNSASLVYTTYYTRRDFDINLKRAGEALLERAPYLYRPFTRLVLAYALLRFDIFHVFCDRGILPPPGRMGIDPRELDILKRAGKLLYTYTYGADVRTRERTLTLGGLNFCMDCPEPGKYCICDDAAGRANMGAIEQRATAMLAMGDMIAYVPRGRDLHFWPLDTRSIARSARPVAPRRPTLRVAHAPNHAFFKGTAYLEAAVSRLRSEGYAVELLRIQGVPNSEVLRLFGEADIVAEQFIGGFHGYTALEAMAVGRPVLCYIRSPELLIDADTCPIINATPQTLYQVLRDILAGKHDLTELGRRGQWYVEKYYSIEAVAARLGRLYLETAGLPPHTARKIEGQVGRLESRLPDIAMPVDPRAPRRDADEPVKMTNES